LLTEATVSCVFTSPLLVLFLLSRLERKLHEEESPPDRRDLGGYGEPHPTA
jgi:hypothetical protein